MKNRLELMASMADIAEKESQEKASSKKKAAETDLQKDLPKALHLYNSVAEGSKYPRAFTRMYTMAILSLVFEVSVSGSVKRDHLIQLIKENEAKKPTAIHDAIAKNPFEPITKPPKLPRTRTQRKDSPSSSSSSSSSPLRSFR
jgi:hypothetical protein